MWNHELAKIQLDKSREKSQIIDMNTNHTLQLSHTQINIYNNWMRINGMNVNHLKSFSGGKMENNDGLIFGCVCVCHEWKMVTVSQNCTGLKIAHHAPTNIRQFTIKHWRHRNKSLVRYVNMFESNIYQWNANGFLWMKRICDTVEQILKAYV